MGTEQLTFAFGAGKRCTRCKREFPRTDEFWQRRKGARDGYRDHCRVCIKAKMRMAYLANQEARIEYERAKRAKDPEAYNRQQKEWRQARIEEKHRWEREYRDKNRQAVRDADKRYRENLTGVRLIRYHLRAALGVQMRRCLRGQKGGRTFEKLVGYTRDQLIAHLEVLFLPGMDWSNYGNKPGQWSVDHKIPMSWFNITSAECEDFKKCWALDNLQPMRHTENCSNVTASLGDSWAFLPHFSEQ